MSKDILAECELPSGGHGKRRRGREPSWNTCRAARRLCITSTILPTASGKQRETLLHVQAGARVSEGAPDTRRQRANRRKATKTAGFRESATRGMPACWVVPIRRIRMRVLSELLGEAMAKHLWIRVTWDSADVALRNQGFIANHSLRSLDSQIRRLADLASEYQLDATHHLRDGASVLLILVPREWAHPQYPLDKTEPQTRLAELVARLVQSAQSLARRAEAPDSGSGPRSDRGAATARPDDASQSGADEDAEAVLGQLGNCGATLEVETPDGVVSIPPLPPDRTLVAKPKPQNRRKVSGRIIAVFQNYALLDSRYALRTSLFTDADRGRWVVGEATITTHLLKYAVADSFSLAANQDEFNFSHPPSTDSR